MPRRRDSRPPAILVLWCRKFPARASISVPNLDIARTLSSLIVVPLASAINNTGLEKIWLMPREIRKALQLLEIVLFIVWCHANRHNPQSDSFTDARGQESRTNGVYWNTRTHTFQCASSLFAFQDLREVRMHKNYKCSQEQKINCVS